jgi:hypothetical protein
MAVVATSLVTLAQLKAFLNIPTATTTWDTVLEMIIDMVSGLCSEFLGREALGKATYSTVYLDSEGEADFWLPNYPIVSITSIYENDVLLTEGLTSDYVFYASEGRVHRIGGTWAKGTKMIKITYVAGYAVQGATPGTGEVALPGGLKYACLLQCAVEYKHHKTSDWGEDSKSLDGVSVNKNNTDPLLPQVKAALQRYAVLGGA